MNLFKHVWREADMSTLSPMPPENANEDAQLLSYVSLFSDYRYLDGPLLLQIISCAFELIPRTRTQEIIAVVSL